MSVLAAALAALVVTRLALAHGALLGVSRAGLRELAGAGQRRAERLTAVLARREVALGAVVLAHDLALAGLALALWRLSLTCGGVPAAWGWGLLVVTLGLLELPARLSAAADPETAALGASAWIEVCYRVLGPLLRAVQRERVTERDDEDEAEAGESLLELVEAAPLDAARQARIAEILEFPERCAGDVMVPRVELVALPADASVAEAAALMGASGRSRLPLYGGSLDEVVGVVHARDLLVESEPVGGVRALARPPLFVAESARLDQLLRELRRNRCSLAVVVDEYGGTAGLVSVEDVVEEIVGEIHDESDVEPPPALQPRPAGGWLVAGRLELTELWAALGLGGEPPEPINTVGGLVLSLAGDLPEVGEAVLYEAAGARLGFLITAVDGHRLVELVVVVLPDGEQDDESGDKSATEGVRLGRVGGALSLAALERALGYEPTAAHAQVADLFAFWPTGQRQGRGVRWRQHRATVTADHAGELEVALTSAVGQDDRIA